MQIIHNALRRFLRLLLALETRLVIKKHNPEIIVILGDDNPSFIREIIYYTISENRNARRNLERTESEFSIPLTVFGTLYYPERSYEWIIIVIKTALQLLYIKPYSHTLILQLQHVDSQIFLSWLTVLQPSLIIAGGNMPKLPMEYDDVPYVEVESQLFHAIQKGQDSKQIQEMIHKLSHYLGLSTNAIYDLIERSPPPQLRIEMIAGKNKSILIDARHYYHPPSTISVTELTDTLPGKKYVISQNKHDSKGFSSEYEIITNRETIIPKENDVYIFRGNKDSLNKEIQQLALHPFEI